MTFYLGIGGTDVAGKMVLPDGLGEVTSAADGQPNECLITVDDPDGTMTFLELDQVIAAESACAFPRMFTGIVTQAVHRRGTYKDGPGRVWDITFTDLNERMHRRVLHAADADRPSETGTERLDWLMGTVALNGLLTDNGQIMANAWQYDPADYRGEYADDVLSSIVSASAVSRWTFFAYWDPVAEDPSLFYGDVTTTTYDSTLALTNYLPDKDDSTIFAPYIDTALTSEAEGIYDGVYVNWEGGRLYRQRASTFAAYGIHRDGVMDSVRINNATTADRHAETWLDYHSGPTRIVTCTVQLPRDKVNLLDAGMRVAAYFTHIEGYDDPGYTYARVTRRSVSFTNGRNDLYDVRLELSNRGISQSGGGGSPGDFPLLPPPAPVHWWSGSLVIYGDGGPDIPADGQAWSYPNGKALGNVETYTYHLEWVDDGHLYARGIGIQSVYTFPLGGGGSNNCLGGIGPPDGPISYTLDGTFSTPSSGTFDGAALVYVATTAAAGPHDHLAHGTLTFWIDPDGWDTGDTPSPPSPGQWVLGEVLAMSGAVGTTVWPYAAGSPKVRVDGVLISSASYAETDPAAGTITLSWTPDADETVTIDYQGA